ncbi:hypothetical protein GCM10009037_31010 [Halarchaeum grantii]|uniref:Putative peptidase inhibitor domain-containing protein n=1 Tax=Halarchaeum grantii TaxID=1193105 RepID=A0A830FDW1_9EURY|nr:hypothetical protein [Halarchaeum grantii]GGL45370.1 hypothetical protein GCM10009037_31010 [Halarchaeum grantii]
MPAYVDSQVEKIRGSECETTVSLLLGVSGDQEAVIERVEQESATVDSTLGRATLRVTAPESVVNALCSIGGISSIEIERDDVY